MMMEEEELMKEELKKKKKKSLRSRLGRAIVVRRQEVGRGEKGKKKRKPKRRYKNKVKVKESSEARTVTTFAAIHQTQFFNTEAPDMQTTPFYVFSESYGGKMAAAYGVALHKGKSAIDRQTDRPRQTRQTQTERERHFGLVFLLE